MFTIAGGIILAVVILANLEALLKTAGALLLVALVAGSVLLVVFLISICANATVTFEGILMALAPGGAIAGFFVLTNHPALDTRPEVRAAWQAKQEHANRVAADLADAYAQDRAKGID